MGPEPLQVWVGTDEVQGVAAQPRKDLRPPPHWRLEAVAATERPRSPTVGADGTTAVFIHDRDSSDVWLLDLDGGTPVRLTTGRAPMPSWEDTEPRLSPDGSTVAYADEGHVCVVPASGGPSRRVVEAGSPVWLGDDRLVVTVERDDVYRLAIVDVADAWPRRLAVDHGGLTEEGDEWGAAVSPDGTCVAYSFWPRAELLRMEVRVVDVGSGSVRLVCGEPEVSMLGPVWSPDGTRLAFTSQASGWRELVVTAPDGTDARQVTKDEADFAELEWHSSGERLVAVRSRRGRRDLVSVDVATGAVEVLAPGGTWGAPHWTSTGAVLATYEGHVTPPELRLVEPGKKPRSLLAPAPLAVARAPHVEPEEVVYASSDGLEIPALLYRPAGASADEPAACIVYPHGGPRSYTGDEWDGHAQYFVDRGYGWLSINYRGSTELGRDFERLNHGDWGVGDAQDCIAAAGFLRTVDWVDADRLGIFGASYGSYLALLAATDDPEHRYRCAVLKYGDCDILTSWAQGDRDGVQWQEEMLGHPSRAKHVYVAGSPVHRLANLRAPLLIAHGERDARVHPKQSEQLVAALRRLGDATFEYVTYPTEAHGLLRAGPQLDFYRRLERFLDWHLL